MKKLIMLFLIMIITVSCNGADLPEELGISVGDTFWLDCFISKPNKVSTVGSYLGFDTTSVEYIKAEQGSFLKGTGDDFFVASVLESDPSKLTFSYSHLTPSWEGFTSDSLELVASFQFRAKKKNEETIFTLSEGEVTDFSGDIFEVQEWVGTSFAIMSIPPVGEMRIYLKLRID